MRSIYYQGKYDLNVQRGNSLVLPISFLGAFSSRSENRELYIIDLNKGPSVRVYDSLEMAKEKPKEFTKIKLYSRGKIVIPDEVLQRVSSSGLVSAVGNLTFFELWNPDSYISRPDARVESQLSAFEEVH